MVIAVVRQRAIAAEVRGTDWLVEETCLFATEGTEEGLGLPRALKVVSGRLQYERRGCLALGYRSSPDRNQRLLSRQPKEIARVSTSRSLPLEC